MVAPSVDPKQSLDVSYSPYWKDIGQWSKIQDIIKDFFRNQPPGVFVEVGAVDGEFMSHTLYLEKYLNWTGLLIEPDPRSFQEMISKRNVWMSPMCINQNSYIAFKKFWLRTVQESLPHRYKLLFYSQSKLNSETFIEDEYGGSYIWIPCTWISVLLLAADLRTIDFLSISTGISDDGKVMDLVNDEYIDVKTLLVQYPVTRIADDPYPSLDGYIMDSVRSQQLVKFYVNLSHCNFLGNTTCRTYHYFDKMESCYSFMCFNNTIIRTFRPNLDIALKPVLVNDTAS